MPSPEQPSSEASEVVIKKISNKVAQGRPISLRDLCGLGEALYYLITTDIGRPLMKGSKAVLMYAPFEEPTFPFLHRGALELYHKAQQQQGQPDTLIIHYDGKNKLIQQDVWEIRQRVSAVNGRKTFRMRWDVGGVIPVTLEPSKIPLTTKMLAKELLAAYTYTIEELATAF